MRVVEMKGLKSDDDMIDTLNMNDVDRLSSLPESLIFEILSFLETRDVVQTSLLSKGWKDLWTTIPYLDFLDVYGENLVGTRKLIDGVLQRWKGTKILRFRILLGSVISEGTSNDVALWTSFATEKKVEYLNLYHKSRPYGCRVTPPECLFSSSSLTKLRLSGFSLQTQDGIIPKVRWDRLKTLQLFDIVDMNEEFVQQVVSSAPQLEALCMSIHDYYGNISIKSGCLKRLRLYLTLAFKFSIHDLTVTVRAPNLEKLTLSGFSYTSRLVLDAPALTEADLLPYPYKGDVQVAEGLKQLLLPMQHVEVLTLCLEDYMMLRLMKGKCLFPNVKILEINYSEFKFHDIGCIPDLFPKVEKLVIFSMSWENRVNVALFRSHDFGEKHFEANNLESSFLLQLRRVEVTWSYLHTDNIHKLITFLLKDAIMVQKIVFKRAIEDDFGSEKIPQKMLSLQSSFPTVDMIFL